jgi:peptide/nickel transport system substrate-binding protein
MALVAGLSLVAAACGGDDDESTATEAPSTEAPSTEAPTETPAATEAPEETPPATEAPAGDVAMTVTIDLNPDAVWDDGTPITVADLECTWLANLNTPGSIATVGYDQIVSVEAGESDSQAVVSFNAVYAPYKTLFNPIIKADAVADCNDISADFQTELPFSGREWKIESWSESQVVMVPNEAYWGDAPVVGKAVMVPLADSDTEIAALKAGEVDFIYPQFFSGIDDALADPNIKVSINFGGDYEALYFQQYSDDDGSWEEGPFADPVFREAFSKSIDREALFQQIYVPLVDGATLLNCGPIVPGKYCPDGIFQDTYDLEGANALLEGEGWTKNADGLWEKDGVAPEIRWMINTGNSRRESTQDYLIPLLRAAGFNVIADNCEAECVFQQRLPAMDYDLAMYISTAPPDPGYLTPAFTCDNIPSEENDFQGQNQQGWCNQEASDALHEADVTVDEGTRAELIQGAITAMETDHVLLPLFQFPKSGAYRTDKVAGPVEDELNNFRAFSNFGQWEDLDGDGQIVIGAEQWPACLNPVTECANSSWYVWTVAFPVMPGVWDTTSDGDYATTALVIGEPEVVVAG